MEWQQTRDRLTGCYIAIPTLYRDSDLALNLPGMRRHVRFLLDGGVRTGNGVLLVCGAAGNFPTLTADERLRIAEAVIAEAAGKVSVIVGAQSPDQREAVAIARGAAKLGADAVQVSPPYYYPPTDDDVIDYVTAIAEAGCGIVLYPTYWLGYKMPLEVIARLCELPQVLGLKWSTTSQHEYERGIRQFRERLCMIDNNGQHVLCHLLGGRGFNTHPSNFWPQWGVRLWELMEAGKYREAQQELTRVYTPWEELMAEICRFTGGEGHLDQLCLEAVGLDSSRSRPPTRDVRPLFFDKVREYVRRTGAPGANR